MVENDGLSNTDRAQAGIIAERLRDIVEQLDDLALSVCEVRQRVERSDRSPINDLPRHGDQWRKPRTYWNLFQAIS